MKRYIREIALLLALATIAWGVFLLEDGLFNTGSADIKEFGLGLVFMLCGLLYTIVLFSNKSWFTPLSPALRIGFLILISIMYTAYVYSRWSNRDEQNSQIVTGKDMIVGHVKASNEWIMVQKSMLQRSAHWYESGVYMSYLADDEQQSLSIRLPAKFLPLKSIKEL